MSGFTFKSTISSIGTSAFEGCSKLASADLPGNLATLGTRAFYGCSGLKFIGFPTSMSAIPANAFYGCSGLTTITIPANFTSIGNNAFQGCSGLRLVDLSVNLTTIGTNAFYGCSNLPRVTIPVKVTSIGGGAFQNCSAITEVTINGTTAPTITNTTFNGVNSAAVLYVQAGTLSQYKNSTNWNSHFIKIIELGGGSGEGGEGGEGGDTNPEYGTLIEITEGEASFSTATDKYYETIKYTRQFNNTNWQALYLPFDIDYSTLSTDFQVAYINNAHQWDDNEDGTIDRTEIEAIFIKSGTVRANTPYLIRAKSTGVKTITVTGRTVYATVENSIDCSSTTSKYTFTGTYNRLTSSELTGCYALSGGAWKMLEAGSYLNPFRIYMKIESRGASFASTNLSQIQMRIIGDDGTTEIIEVESNSNNDGAIYDLSGRRVEKPTKGVYIINNKKVLY